MCRPAKQSGRLGGCQILAWSGWNGTTFTKGFTKPFQLFRAHSDIGGIGVIGKYIYISEFGYSTAPAGVVTVPLAGGKPKQFLSGFASSGPAPTATIGLGVHDGWVYVGTTTGVVYRIHS